MTAAARPFWIALSIVVAALWAAYTLNLNWAGLAGGASGLRLAGEFFHHMLQPALRYESAVPAGSVPLLIKCLESAWWTVVYAAGAISLAIIGGVLLGFSASTAWWSDEIGGRDTAFRRIVRAWLGPTTYTVTRVVIALMRSIHELLWAVLLLAAFGISPLAAAIAIAIPSTGTLAKIYSEMIDETPRDAAHAMRDAGASPLQTYLFALLSRALPDLVAYTLYRFECALRTSAVLGFFGFPTLGFYIAAAFENLHYAEVWTYLYTLFALVAAVDWWSGAVRRSLLA